MTIRPYEASDYPQLLAVTLAAFQPFFTATFPAMIPDPELVQHQHGNWREDYERQLPDLLRPDGPGQALVAVEGQDVVGYIIWQPDRRPAHANIEILAVSPDAQGRGLGEQLMHAAMETMRADGVRFVGLGTGGDAFHAPARRLYDRLGFHPIPVVAYLRRL